VGVEISTRAEGRTDSGELVTGALLTEVRIADGSRNLIPPGASCATPSIRLRQRAPESRASGGAAASPAARARDDAAGCRPPDLRRNELHPPLDKNRTNVHSSPNWRLCLMTTAIATIGCRWRPKYPRKNSCAKRSPSSARTTDFAFEQDQMRQRFRPTHRVLNSEKPAAGVSPH
jgi:hypothetical protein